MHKLILHRKRLAAVCAALVTLTLGLSLALILRSGLIEGASPEADQRKARLEAIYEKEITLEGQFLDRSGAAITLPQTPGQAAAVVDGEAYSYLIGYNSPIYGTSGLRSSLSDYLYTGGSDHCGAAVTLTLDAALQEDCYRLLDGHAGSVIVLEADTGAVLACASRSADDMGMDVNQIDSLMPTYLQRDGFLLNSALRSEDPPGSTFKLITSACLIENGLAGYTMDDTGSFRYGSMVITNHDDLIGGPGVTLQTALVSSLNTYFASAGCELGTALLGNTAQGFLYDAEYDLDFGTLRASSSLPGNLNRNAAGSAAFGQGELVTSPLQICCSMAAFLNDGQLMKPYLIRQIQDEGSVCYAGQPELLSQACSAETAQSVRALAAAAAQSYGLTYPEGTVYAKTGTAETASGLYHAYLLLGLETDSGHHYAVLIDWRETTSGSGQLLRYGEMLLTYLRQLDETM